MPTATDEQRDLMKTWFGDSISDVGPTRLLVSHGYWFTHGGMIKKPTPSHTVHDIEWQCICFLCDEWDYGFDPA